MLNAGKFAGFLFMAAILCAVFPKNARADDTSQCPTGYMTSPLDRYHTEADTPEIYRPSAGITPNYAAPPLPVSYDIRQHISLPSPRSQKPWATCWAHVALGSVETAYIARYSAESIDLSEMHPSYFVYGDPRPGKSFGKPHPDKDILDQGGNADQSVAFLSRMGTVSESILPYSNTKPEGLPEDYESANIRLKSAYYLPSPSKDPGTAKRFIMNTGGVQISYFNNYGSYYKGRSGLTAFYNNTQPYTTNHSVLLIGWDDNFSRENFSEDMRPEHNGAWLARNSWGKRWYSGRYGKYVGENGCFWMSYEQPVAEAVIFIPEKSEPGLRHYGYDDLGFGAFVRKNWCANIFRAEGNEILKYVGFQTSKNNTSCGIYIYDLGTESPDSPVNGTLSASLADFYAQYQGYHTAEISGFLSAGHYFSVVVKTNNSGLASEGSLNWATGEPYSAPVCNPGESFESSDGTSWTERGSNVCIKAFTVPANIAEINSENFPDKIFREYIRNNFDADGNGVLTLNEIAGAAEINVPGMGISSLKGIECFTALTSLNCGNNHLRTLDVSANTALETVNCGYQTSDGLTLSYSGGKYFASLKNYVSDTASIKSISDTAGAAGDYDPSSGTASFTSRPEGLRYEYNIGHNQHDTFMSVAVTFDTLYLPEAYYDSEYSCQLDPSPDTSAVRSISGGNLPEGLILTSTGKICGAPSETGVFTFTVKAVVSGVIKAEEKFTLTVSPSPVILPHGFVGTPYRYSLEAFGGLSTENSASALPDGLTVNSAGIISGTPLKSGTYRFRITAVNAGKLLRLTVKPRKNIRITPERLPNTKWGKHYSKRLRAYALKSPSWEITSGTLPDGLSLAKSGRISGITEGAGAFTFTVNASNGAVSADRTYAITARGIKPRLKGRLTGGTAGDEYLASLTASGTSPFAWEVSNLPAGLAYSTEDGGKSCVISGIPYEKCRRRVSVKLSNAAGNITKRFTVRISESTARKN